MDYRDQVCGEYKVVDKDRLLFSHVKDHPLSKCGGVFGFSNDKISPIINWARDAIKMGKERCE